MTQDEIIAMARKAGDWNGQTAEFNDVGLKRFASLVAEHERKRIAKRVADTTLSLDINLSHMGCEESKSISINLVEFSKLIGDDK